jgi:hypothetical protein
MDKITVKDYIDITNYSDFDIVTDTKEKGLKTIFKINQNTPMQFLSDKLLNAIVKNVYITEKKVREDNEALFLIEIEVF